MGSCYETRVIVKNRCFQLIWIRVPRRTSWHYHTYVRHSKYSLGLSNDSGLGTIIWYVFEVFISEICDLDCCTSTCVCVKCPWARLGRACESSRSTWSVPYLYGTGTCSSTSKKGWGEQASISCTILHCINWWISEDLEERVTARGYVRGRRILVRVYF